jgi:hypothetical protein
VGIVARLLHREQPVRGIVGVFRHAGEWIRL